MGTLIAIFVAMVIAALTPFATFYTHKHIEQGRRMRAFQRLSNEPLLKPGTKLTRLEFAGRDLRVFPGECVLMSIEPGRVEFHSADGKEAVVFTGREIEEMVMVVKLEREAKESYQEEKEIYQEEKEGYKYNTGQPEQTEKQSNSEPRRSKA